MDRGSGPLVQVAVAGAVETGLTRCHWSGAGRGMLGASRAGTTLPIPLMGPDDVSSGAVQGVRCGWQPRWCFQRAGEARREAPGVVGRGHGLERWTICSGMWQQAVGSRGCRGACGDGADAVSSVKCLEASRIVRPRTTTGALDNMDLEQWKMVAGRWCGRLAQGLRRQDCGSVTGRM